MLATDTKNPCEKNICEHKCVAEEDKYRCECSPGYNLREDTKCIGMIVIVTIMYTICVNMSIHRPLIAKLKYKCIYNICIFIIYFSLAINNL